MMNTQIQVMFSGSNNTADENSARQRVRARWEEVSRGGFMEEVTLEVGIRKERRQERGQHLQENQPPEDGATSPRA